MNLLITTAYCIMGKCHFFSSAWRRTKTRRRRRWWNLIVHLIQVLRM